MGHIVRLRKARNLLATSGIAVSKTRLNLISSNLSGTSKNDCELCNTQDLELESSGS